MNQKTPSPPSNVERLRRRLRAIPESPGVYLMRDAAGRVIYVGKALRLRDRLRSYFNPAAPLNPRIAELVRRIFDFEIVTAANEVEALLLECNLIKQYRPRYNVSLKDDKNYLYLKLPRGEAFPQVHYTRRVVDDGARYFGPYTSAQSLRTTVNSLRRLFPFRTCSDDVFRQGRVCLDFHIHRCPGPCEGRIAPEEYQRRLDQLAMFMEGRSGELTRDLTRRMVDAAAKLEFEEAARLRDRLAAMEKIGERQLVLDQRQSDEDLIALATSGAEAYVEVAHVREGKVIGHEGHPVEAGGEPETGPILRGFLLQYYSEATHIPAAVVISHPVAEPAEIESFLAHRRKARSVLRVPRRGRLKGLIDQLAKTAEEGLTQARIKADYEREHTEPMLNKLAQALGVDPAPRRIECYDISNLQGQSAVGSMVVFEGGRPKPEHYRTFRIRFADGPNDFAMMEEMLERRCQRLEAAMRREADDSARDASFSARPDLVIVDGGKGQLGVAVRVLERAGFADIPVFGLAKEREEIFAPGRSDPIVQEHDSPGMFLIQRVRDEAHRFAITQHRKARGRRALSSPLDSVEGIGPVRKRKLMRRFGSLESIRQASLQELTESGVPKAVARRLKELV